MDFVKLCLQLQIFSFVIFSSFCLNFWYISSHLYHKNVIIANRFKYSCRLFIFIEYIYVQVFGKDLREQKYLMYILNDIASFQVQKTRVCCLFIQDCPNSYTGDLSITNRFKVLLLLVFVYVRVIVTKIAMIWVFQIFGNYTEYP